jgi:hypothetical protein
VIQEARHFPRKHKILCSISRTNKEGRERKRERERFFTSKCKEYY